MRKSNRFTLILVLLSALQVIPILARAQENNLNAFSPYTFYGIGDFSTQGPTFLRSMGGIGVAYSNLRRANYVNPASFATINPKSALFNVGIEGGGVYAKTASAKSSYNSFSFRDIALQLPLWGQKIGMGISVTPFSSVGYRVKMYESDPEVLANMGSVRYDYLGDGNITQFKLGVGALLFKNFTIGADLIYYHGKIERQFNTEISNCAGYCLYLAGGEHTFIHNTIANYFSKTTIAIHSATREDQVSVCINDVQKTAPMHSEFVNCIISGTRQEEFGLYTQFQQQYLGNFHHNLIQSDSIDWPQFSANRHIQPSDYILQEGNKLFRNISYIGEDYYDFRLDSASLARDWADVSTAEKYPLDRLGNNRMADGKPDLGAYEYVNGME